MITCSNGVRPMTDKSLAPLHQNRRRLTRKKRQNECSSKAKRQLVKRNLLSSSGGTDLPISLPNTLTRNGNERTCSLGLQDSESRSPLCNPAVSTMRQSCFGFRLQPTPSTTQETLLSGAEFGLGILPYRVAGMTSLQNCTSGESAALGANGSLPEATRLGRKGSGSVGRILMGLNYTRGSLTSYQESQVGPASLTGHETDSVYDDLGQTNGLFSSRPASPIQGSRHGLMTRSVTAHPVKLSSFLLPTSKGHGQLTPIYRFIGSNYAGVDANVVTTVSGMSNATGPIQPLGNNILSPPAAGSVGFHLTRPNGNFWGFLPQPLPLPLPSGSISAQLPRQNQQLRSVNASAHHPTVNSRQHDAILHNQPTIQTSLVPQNPVALTVTLTSADNPTGTTITTVPTSSALVPTSLSFDHPNADSDGLRQGNTAGLTTSGGSFLGNGRPTCSHVYAVPSRLSAGAGPIKQLPLVQHHFPQLGNASSALYTGEAGQAGRFLYAQSTSQLVGMPDEQTKRHSERPNEMASTGSTTVGDCQPPTTDGWGQSCYPIGCLLPGPGVSFDPDTPRSNGLEGNTCSSDPSTAPLFATDFCRQTTMCRHAVPQFPGFQVSRRDEM
ncbi:unnamed protein product, partial [Protopolystoma xenopodis]